jgi:hypothetical protein
MKNNIMEAIMAYMLPLLSIAGGISFCVWGIKRILVKDDSADEKAAKIIASLPSKFHEFIKRIEIKGGLIIFELKDNTPQKIKEEFSKETHTEEIKNQTETTYTTQCR